MTPAVVRADGSSKILSKLTGVAVIAKWKKGLQAGGKRYNMLQKVSLTLKYRLCPCPSGVHRITSLRLL